MKLLLLLFFSALHSAVLSTKCLQCKHSDNIPNQECIDGNFKAKDCKTKGKSCMISLMTNSSAKVGIQISLVKFFRSCAKTKKEDGSCETIKGGMLVCYCNGDGCNSIPANVLYSEAEDSDNFKMNVTRKDDNEFEDVLRLGRLGTGAKAGAGAVTATGPGADGEGCDPLWKKPCIDDFFCALIDPANPPVPPPLNAPPLLHYCKFDPNAVSGPDPASLISTTTTEATPLLKWHGTQTWATFAKENGKQCWDNTALATIIVSGIPIEKKKQDLEEHGCRLDYGLECRNITDTSTNPAQFKNACRCLLSLGPEPAKIPAETVDSGANTKCYIPAGRGYASECFDYPPNTNSRLPPYETLGFPYAAGDPIGSGPDPPQLSDVDHANNINTEAEKLIHYIRWNSIYVRCGPHAECRGGSTYIGRRCQCLKHALLNRALGTCSSSNFISNGGLFLFLAQLIVALFM